MASGLFIICMSLYVTGCGAGPHAHSEHASTMHFNHIRHFSSPMLVEGCRVWNTVHQIIPATLQNAPGNGTTAQHTISQCVGGSEVVLLHKMLPF